MPEDIGEFPCEIFSLMLPFLAAMASLFIVLFWAQVGGIASALAPSKAGPSRPAHTSKGFSRFIKRTGRARRRRRALAASEASDRALVGAESLTSIR